MKRPPDSRCLLAFFSLLLAMGLGACTPGGGGTDAGTDATPGTDGGGGTDSNVPPVCTAGSETVLLWSDFGQTPATNPYTGLATVTGYAQNTNDFDVVLTLEDGTTFNFTYGIGAGKSLPIGIGTMLSVYIDVYQPFWTELVIVLRELPAPGGGGEELIAALWNTSAALPGAALPELALSYGDPGCAPTDWGCGDVVPLTLTAELADGSASTDVGAGDATTLLPYIVVNGSVSERFVGMIQCTDTPTDWIAGMVRAVP